MGDSEFKDINVSNIKKSKLRFTQDQRLAKKKANGANKKPSPDLLESQFEDLPLQELQEEKKKKKKHKKLSRKTKKDPDDLN